MILALASQPQVRMTTHRSRVTALMAMAISMVVWKSCCIGFEEGAVPGAWGLRACERGEHSKGFRANDDQHDHQDQGKEALHQVGERRAHVLGSFYGVGGTCRSSASVLR